MDVNGDYIPTYIGHEEHVGANGYRLLFVWIFSQRNSIFG